MARDVLVDGRTLYVGRPGRPGVDAGDDDGLIYRDCRHLSALSAVVEGREFTPVGRDLEASNRRTVTSATLGSAVNRVDENQRKRSELVRRDVQAVAESAGLSGRLSVSNHSASTFTGTLVVTFDVDFADVFEVRGFASDSDREIDTTVDGNTVRYEYEYDVTGGQSVTRSTTVRFDRQPDRLTAGRATFDLAIGPQESDTVGYAVRPAVGPRDGRPDGGVSEPVAPGGLDASRPIDPPVVATGSPAYDRVFEQARDDLVALTTETDYGPVPLAGTPWFATVFGRDSLITAYQALPVAPELAAGTLRYLAAYQGSTVDDDREEAPGKMFHEIREGELAERGVVPHTPYYGSIDATPLWVVLLAEHYRWTGSTALVDDLAEALDGALGWIERTRDAGEDEFLAYDRSPGVGLRHKAWRDTPGAVQFPDGEVADSPLASVEVQGYVYRALRDGADLYEAVLGDQDRAATLRARAGALESAFESTFWLPDREYYAAAIAGDGSVVPTVTSNVGHCLWSGLVSADRAAAVARTLASDAVATPWGLRTMSTDAAGYSPVSYHLGSVWPHDTSLVAMGLAEYGFESDVERLTRGVLEASTHFDDQRLPELYCGFEDGEPKEYPSACVPQAWSAGTPFALLRAAFGLEPASDGLAVGATPDCLADRAIDGIRQRWSD